MKPITKERRLLLCVLAGTIGFAAGIKINDLRQVVKTAALCPITNQFKSEIHVEIESVFPIQTYTIKSGETRIFSCGDKAKVTSGKYKTKFTIKEGTTFQEATPVGSTTNN